MILTKSIKPAFELVNEANNDFKMGHEQFEESIIDQLQILS